MSDGPKEIFDFNQLILVNQKICMDSKEPFDVNLNLLDEIVSNSNSFNNIPILRDRIIKQVSNLIGGIVFYQPFSNGNKRTALSMGILVLRNNGFDLPYGNKRQKKQLFDLLENTMLKFEGDNTIISDIENYLIENVIEN